MLTPKHIAFKPTAPHVSGGSVAPSFESAISPAVRVLVVRVVSVRSWLLRTCRELHSHNDRPIPIPYEDIHMGNRTTHVSHKLMRYRGFVYCSKCGARSQLKLVGLSQACAPSPDPNSHGRRTLRAISEGRLPYGIKRDSAEAGL